MSNRFHGSMTGMAALVSILALADAPAFAQAQTQFWAAPSGSPTIPETESL